MDYNQLVSLKKYICSDYINYYKEKGYDEAPSLPLDYKEDITLDFTTCTICRAKENIRKGKRGKDYVMIQPALRNTHIDVLSNMHDEDFFFSFFSMMGGFKYYSNNSEASVEFSQIIKNEFDFLKKYMNNIVLTIPIQYKNNLKIDDETMSYLIHNGCKIVLSENDENNLKWKYGISNVVGYGTRWEISNGGDLVNWGNTINVFVNSKPFGVDFGGGVESLIYAYLKLKNSIYANDAMTDMTKEFCEEDTVREKIIDCIVSSMCIISNKKKIILRDKYILETYMRLLYSFMMITNLSEEDILKIVNDINQKNIKFLQLKNMTEIFATYLHKAKRNFDIILNSENINTVLKLFDFCYNESDNNWMKKKRILHNHCAKYFVNLSEVDLLALQKSKEKKLKKERKLV